jgi:hypothetical protein
VTDTILLRGSEESEMYLSVGKRERVRKDSRRVEANRKHMGGSERRFVSEGGGKKEQLVRRYPGNSRSSF